MGDGGCLLPCLLPPFPCTGPSSSSSVALAPAPAHATPAPRRTDGRLTRPRRSLGPKPAGTNRPAAMAETLVLRGTLKGHEGWVTAITSPLDMSSDVILSSSRDKTVIVWKLTREESNFGYPLRSLHGHAHFVQDVVISSDGQFALSG